MTQQILQQIADDAEYLREDDFIVFDDIVTLINEVKRLQAANKRLKAELKDQKNRMTAALGPKIPVKDNYWFGQ